MYVIGTAGHVDHGKSTLIEALTGIDPDRLVEEKAREMTIDLGFAWMKLELGGELHEVGIVDVPGHRDFIENMLAGIGGIDLALFVVAADEGVMPQTSEHLAILDLLEIPAGVVALTKADLVDEPDWLDLVTLDLQEQLAGTVLQDARIVPVSGHTGAGLEELRHEIALRLAQTQPRPDHGRPRLPIDRVFSLPGFGTIVTGTLSGGGFSVGDAVEVHPGAARGRIRGLQTHKTKRETAEPGSRVAVNISSIDAADLRRGMVVAFPGQARDTLLLDAHYRHLAQMDAPLRHNVQVKLFLGAAEVMARTRIIGARQIEPGQSGFLQLALEQPLVGVRGDRFILRRPSPSATLGGGRILDPHPGRRHRRFQQRVIDRLQTLAEGTPEELLRQHVERLQPAAAAEILKQSGLSGEQASLAWQTLCDQGQVMALGQQFVTTPYWNELRRRALQQILHYHEQHPLRLGMPREELRSRLRFAVGTFNAFIRSLVEQGEVGDNGSVLFQAGRKVILSDEQQRRVQDLMAVFERQGVNSPAVKECRAALGDELYEAMLALGRLVQINEEVVYRTTELDDYVQKIVSHLNSHKSVSAAEVRDLLNTSRKYAIALLEHLDRQHITQRIGDERVLAKPYS